MNFTDSLILKETHTALKNIYGERLAKVILFGSYARGEQTQESDIDLLVVLNDAQLAGGKEIRFINDSIFNIALKHNISISAHPVSANRFETESNFFFKRIKTEGKTL